MAAMKTPGVHIVDDSGFPSSVVEVATAVPAFVGYTRKADDRGRPLGGTPWRITSLTEYHACFGGAPAPTFRIDDKPSDDPRAPGGAFMFDGKSYGLTRTGDCHLLYHSLQLFFQNGGSACYIVSVGGYDAGIDAGALRNGIAALADEAEPTLIVIPDAVRLGFDDCSAIQRAALEHCGRTPNRFAILDVWRGYRDRHASTGDPVAAFRRAVGSRHLDLAAAYYPWLNTSVVPDEAVGYRSFENTGVLRALIGADLEAQAPVAAGTTAAAARADMLTRLTCAEEDWKDARGNPLDHAARDAERARLEQSLVSASPLFKAMLAEIRTSLNLLPPGAAVAGVYTTVDTNLGVWRAPANVSLDGVISPAVSLGEDDQQDLDVTLDGKSINAIRSSAEEGALVWGARTLDGNSLDRRYVHVRRTALMLEASIRLATTAFEREPNDANTWAAITSLIHSFLTGIWQRGGLAGGTADEAFSVHVGLGETMTAQDLLDGILRVTVLVALARPAEFIEMTCQLQTRKT
jgi:phage tail sheath protein FI